MTLPSPPGRATLLALLLLALPAAAQSPASSPAPATPAPKVSKEARTKGGRKVIKLEAITVEGRIQKPQAFYILQRQNLNFEELNRTESFLNKVLKSVERDPF
ncbi:MAG: hypothetical protein ACLPJH_12600 [Myxococcaceae bacterium]